MKSYNKIALLAAGLFLATSCDVNDPFADKMDIGQVLPTTSWELSSTVCKAGEEARSWQSTTPLPRMHLSTTAKYGQ